MQPQVRWYQSGKGRSWICRFHKRRYTLAWLWLGRKRVLCFRLFWEIVRFCCRSYKKGICLCRWSACRYNLFSEGNSHTTRYWKSLQGKVSLGESRPVWKNEQRWLWWRKPGVKGKSRYDLAEYAYAGSYHLQDYQITSPQDRKQMDGLSDVWLCSWAKWLFWGSYTFTMHSGVRSAQAIVWLVHRSS